MGSLHFWKVFSVIFRLSFVGFACWNFLLSLHVVFTMFVISTWCVVLVTCEVRMFAFLGVFVFVGSSGGSLGHFAFCKLKSLQMPGHFLAQHFCYCGSLTGAFESTLNVDLIFGGEWFVFKTRKDLCFAKIGVSGRSIFDHSN